MCDEECRARFKAIELNVNSMRNDLKWIRWMIRTAIVIGAAVFGIDVTGVI